ncbi:MAG: gliding motility protein GldN [Bacteroidota bacterium]
MTFLIKRHCLWLATLCLCVTLQAQQDSEQPDAPLNGVVERKLKLEKRMLPYDNLREADVVWEKRIWRVIDVREKMNLPFTYPKRPLFSILLEAASQGNMIVYENEEFQYPLSLEEMEVQTSFSDTLWITNPDDLTEKQTVIRTDIDPNDVKRFRLKEVWYFDEESASMKVRILGIAPVREVLDDFGNFKYEQTLFWIYYPHARQLLAREQAYTRGNDAAPTTWEDIFEMRYFSSYVYKQSNERDERIQDYLAGGTDRLLEGEKIEQELFNFEQDLWSY